MIAAYVDTSALVAVAFDEPGGRELGVRLGGFGRLLAANLLEAELRAAFQRFERPIDEDLLGGLDWILPSRPLTPEITRVQAAAYLRGADLWHLACALYVAPDPAELAFVTRDARQGEAAGRLGFLA